MGHVLLVDALKDLVMLEEAVHGKTSLLCVIRIGPVDAAAVAPPEETAIVEIRFTGVVYGTPFGQSGVAERGVKQRFTALQPDKNVFGIGNVMPVLLGAVQAELIEKGLEVKNLRAIHGYGGSGVQIWVNFRLPRHEDPLKA
jgi:hypothetical protein